MQQLCIRLSYAETDNGDVSLSYGDWKSSQPEDSDTSFEEYLTWLGQQKKPRDTIDGLGKPDIPVCIILFIHCLQRTFQRRPLTRNFDKSESRKHSEDPATFWHQHSWIF